MDFIKVYDLVTKTPEKSRNLVRRSSDFIKLEKIADEYEQKEIKNDWNAGDAWKYWTRKTYPDTPVSRASAQAAIA